MMCADVVGMTGDPQGIKCDDVGDASLLSGTS